MIQSTIIEKILNSLCIWDESKMNDKPENDVLTGDKDKNGRKQEWNYCSVIVQMNYLAETTRPDIISAVHQWSKYSINPKQPHEESVKSIGRYLKKTKYKGLVFALYGSNGLEYYANAYFTESWCRENED